MGFEFRLKKVLEHRKRLEDEAKRDYLDAQSKTMDAQAELKRMFTEIDEARARTQKQLGLGSSAAELVATDAFIDGQNQLIEKQRLRIRELKESEERFQEVLVGAAKEKKTLEHLEQRQKEEYLGRIEKQEIAESDDITIMRFRRGEGP